MSKVYEKINHQMAGWIHRQPIFFVASAPLAASGRVNVSPKGLMGTLVVLDPHSIAYLDYTGTGAETIAHLRENGRITVMFCAFEGRPKIVRLYGRGRYTVPGEPEFDKLRELFEKTTTAGQRSIIIVDIDRITDSCGWSVPLMDYREDRAVLDLHNERRDDAYFEKYWQTTNADSIDGLPALRSEPEPEPGLAPEPESEYLVVSASGSNE
ncbi:pyridoxamine 5'-phosphate oxidase-related FMN- binding [Catenulispora acidiphila DSM 44928]|uniref:Pyridoxamine 5'-phosphate oxidase-related FMN-binding n=1 Tax=Catenulispora acidiphila (strain DSM 44928 / JCM 14897 / NBRC 102108 / NRRL B-24433 / ID139908) TaxID=479433 RepID=C7PXC1_CATAD|nr:pyridoxamine 5'-phosphate oxidase family protein [Catenulispora acidiphila]ACU69472.1 pyridoxamine 5'-phosphate oxidase-related FMN- binding [Catenulispora acidiphila DSM 44928]